MELTQEQIEKINKACPYGQGVFMQPFGIPHTIKELVVYTKWESGGRPGSCWDDEYTINNEYVLDKPDDAFEVLDLVLREINPNVSFLDYKKIIGMMESNTKTDYGYYGGYTEDTIEWITLSDLIDALN